jgi:hypothetical protein
MSEPTPIVNEHYLRHVADGWCPYTQGKTWCNGKAGHVPSHHWALYKRSDGSVDRVDLLTARDPRR